MQLGIDFGTWYSSAILYLDDGTLQPIKEPQCQSASIPSSVYLTDTGEFVIGYAADNLCLQDPARYAREIKLDLFGDRTPRQLGDRLFKPENLVTVILAWFKREADRIASSLGYPPITGAVLTVPALYRDYLKELMKEAAVAAGFREDEIRLLSEPVAAAVDFARRSVLAKEEILLIYDLGGGTFDAALVQKQGRKKFDILGVPDGLEDCGGVHFDRLLYRWVLEQASPALRALLDRHNTTLEARQVRMRVLKECRRVKHLLSEVEETSLSIPLPGAGAWERPHLTREEFTRLLAPHLEKTIECCRKVMASADIGLEQVNRVLLVGGSCRIPAVMARVKQALGREVVLAPELELAICWGAAVYGARLPVPVSDEAQNQLLAVHRLMGEQDLEGALRCAQYACDLAPAWAEALQVKADVLLRKGELQFAIAAATNSLNLDPDETKAYLIRGIARVQIQDYEQALEDFDQLLSDDSIEDIIDWAVCGAIYRAMAHTHLGNFVAAVADLQRALTYPEECFHPAVLYALLGFIHIKKLHAPAEALTYFANALERLPALVEVTVPLTRETVIKKTKIATWHKEAGSDVQKNENLVDVDIHNMVLEVPAPKAGLLQEVLKGNGEAVTEGEVIALIRPYPLSSQADELTCQQFQDICRQFTLKTQGSPIATIQRGLWIACKALHGGCSREAVLGFAQHNHQPISPLVWKDDPEFALHMASINAEQSSAKPMIGWLIALLTLQPKLDMRDIKQDPWIHHLSKADRSVRRFLSPHYSYSESHGAIFNSVTITNTSEFRFTSVVVSVEVKRTDGKKEAPIRLECQALPPGQSHTWDDVFKDPGFFGSNIKRVKISLVCDQGKGF